MKSSGPINRIFPLLLLSLVAPFLAAQSIQQLSPAAIYERTHSSVVVIIVLDNDSKPIGQGSGFIIAKDRVITNHHVIEGAEGALIVFADGKSGAPEGIAADSQVRDLSVLAVKTGSRPALKLGDELKIKQGDSVYALGAPRGLELSLTNGIVSGFRDIDGEFLIQTTAAIAPGSSGGPLFDSLGRVVGVTTSRLADSPGIYFSVSAGDVSRLLRAPGIIVPLSSQRPDHETVHTAPAPGRGAIHVVTDVIGATAVLHGPAGHVLSKCETPCSFNNIKPQRYGLEVQKEGYQPVQIALQIKDGEAQDQEIKLEPLAKGIFISTQPPGADVFINGAKQSGQTPVTLPLAPGQYNLVLRMQGYEPYSGSIQVKDIQTPLHIELTERSATHVAWAQVNSNPKGAEIIVDGSSTGEFTPSRIQVPTGLHTVTLKLNGYQFSKRTFQASEGGTVIVEVPLRPQ